MASKAQPWIKDTLLCAQTLWISPSWVADRSAADVRGWAREAKSAGFEAIWAWAKWHDGLCYWQSESSPHTDTDYVGEIVDESTKLGLRVVAYLSIGEDDLAAKATPAWKSVDVQGLPCYQGYGFDYNCLTSPYGDYVLRQIEELLRGYDVDGLWLDHLYFPPHGCFCAFCRARFAEQTGKDIRVADREAISLFQSGVLAEFVSAVELLRDRYRPDVLLTYNGAGSWQHPDYTAQEARADYYTREGHSFASVSWGGKLLRTQGKPFEMTLSGCIRENWIHWVLKPRHLLMAEAAYAAAHGAVVNMSFNPTPEGMVRPAEWDNLRAVAGWMQERRDTFLGWTSQSDVALLRLPEQVRVVGPYNPQGTPRVNLDVAVDARRDGVSIDVRRKPLNHIGSGKRHAIGTSFEGYLRALDEAQVTWDVASTDAPSVLARYQCVVVNGPLSDATIDRLDGYVRAGGSLLVNGAALHGDWGTARVWELLGLRHPRVRRAGVSYVSVGDDALRQNLLDYPVLIQGDPVEVEVVDAKVLARLAFPAHEWSWIENPGSDWHAPGVTTDIPAVTLRRVGSGTVAWIGVPVAEHIAMWADNDPWAKLLLQNLIRMVVQRPLVELPGAAPGLRVVTGTRDGDLVVHLINSYPAHGESFSDRASPRLGQVRLRIRADGVDADPVVRLEPGRKQLDVVRQEGWLEVVIPDLELHTAICVSPRSRE